MPRNNYHIQLKGYVGGEDFDRAAVDAVLAGNAGQSVNVLIESLGGSLATGLSISNAFKQHGNVSVHFVGLNASAATVASLGAKRITIDAGAMYLVHKCSMEFFEWGSLNADQFEQLIGDCEKIKADLDKLDRNAAQLYAARCRRTPEELLALMKEGGWLTAKEALDWGFVDAVTDIDGEEAAVLTDAAATAMAAAGMPIPNIPIARGAGVAPEDRSASFLEKFCSALTAIFTSKQHTPMKEETPKTYTEAEYNALEEQFADASKMVENLKGELEAAQSRISQLEAQLDKTPAASSTQVVDDARRAAEPKTAAELYVATYNSARLLYDALL